MYYQIIANGISLSFVKCKRCRAIVKPILRDAGFGYHYRKDQWNGRQSALVVAETIIAESERMSANEAASLIDGLIDTILAAESVGGKRLNVP